MNIRHWEYVKECIEREREAGNDVAYFYDLKLGERKELKKRGYVVKHNWFKEWQTWEVRWES